MCAQREEEYDRKENINLESNSMGIIYRKRDPRKSKKCGEKYMDWKRTQ